MVVGKADGERRGPEVLVRRCAIVRPHQCGDDGSDEDRATGGLDVEEVGGAERTSWSARPRSRSRDHRGMVGSACVACCRRAIEALTLARPRRTSPPSPATSSHHRCAPSVCSSRRSSHVARALVAEGGLGHFGAGGVDRSRARRAAPLVGAASPTSTVTNPRSSVSPPSPSSGSATGSLPAPRRPSEALDRLAVEVAPRARGAPGRPSWVPARG